MSAFTAARMHVHAVLSCAHVVHCIRIASHQLALCDRYLHLPDCTRVQTEERIETGCLSICCLSIPAPA